MSRAVLLSLFLAGISAGAAAAINDADREFARPHQMVDIGSRRLNLYCAGSGPVTVVFDAPSGDGGWTWHGVQPKIAARTRACVYDRAARGFSDPSPLPPTFGNAVSDLHALLGKAGIAPPYVLVGNSFGGAVAQLYAYRYPQDVKALDVWVADDLIRRLEMTAGEPGHDRSIDLEFYDFGADISIQPPA